MSGLKTHSEFLTDSGSQLDATRTQLYRLADMIFSSKQADRDYFLGKKADDEATVIKKYRSLKPCIHGSDAHMNENIFEPSQNKYCWIKADLHLMDCVSCYMNQSSVFVFHRRSRR
mgnify:CR=1 FL=1